MIGVSQTQCEQVLVSVLICSICSPSTSISVCLIGYNRIKEQDGGIAKLLRVSVVLAYWLHECAAGYEPM